jgi:16S rRNA (cytosine967-C5)-methyltransferase
MLVRVEGGAFASRLLERVQEGGVRARVLGVLRWLRRLDEALGALTRRPLAKLDPEVRAVLRLGLFEAADLGVPPPVATDAAVRLVRRLGKGSAAGMVNAVLRRAGERWQALDSSATPDLRLSHPRWLYERWCSAFGREAAVRMMEVNQTPAGLWVWWANEAEARHATAGGLWLAPHPWCPGAWRSPADAPALARAVAADDAYAQDPSSQLVAHVTAALGATLDAATLLDLCAAPGGKTALAVRLHRWRTAVAGDLRLGRLRLLKATLARLGGAALAAVADAERPPFAPQAWSLVVLDAPCSGTGTLRRHPELRWRLAPDAIATLAARQLAMVEAARELVAAGGVLLYSTCSVEPEENERLFEEVPPGWAVEPLEPLLPPGTPAVATTAGGVTILPAPANDGFSLHALRRLNA